MVCSDPFKKLLLSPMTGLLAVQTQVFPEWGNIAVPRGAQALRADTSCTPRTREEPSKPCDLSLATGAARALGDPHGAKYGGSSLAAPPARLESRAATPGSDLSTNRCRTASSQRPLS